MKKEYTFDDWLNYEIHREFDYEGSIIYNDSEKYLNLVLEGKMSYETLNEIQEAQAKTYQMIIDSTIEFMKIKFNRLIKYTPDVKRKIEADIRYAEKFLSDQQEIYDDVIYPVLHRGIKKGAKFITAAQYRDVVLNNKKKHALYQVVNNVDDNNIWIDVPFAHEWIYCKVEVGFFWLKFLEEKLKNGLISEKGNYVLKNESVILKLFEEYGIYFPDETKESWKQRWINGNDTLTAINIDTFKNGNNKHLILTILHEAHRPRFLKVDNMAVYTKKRWGLSSYHSDLTKYLGFDKVKNCYADPHPELKNITDILKLEQI